MHTCTQEHDPAERKKGGIIQWSEGSERMGYISYLDKPPLGEFLSWQATGLERTSVSPREASQTQVTQAKMVGEGQHDSNEYQLTVER